MIKARIEKEIFINEYIKAKDTTTSGYLTLKATETIRLHKIRANVCADVRGKVTNIQGEILTLRLSDEQELIKNESYKIPFTIDLSSLVDPYQGINVNISYFLEIKLFVKMRDVKKLEKGFDLETTGLKRIQNVIEFQKYFSIKKTNLDFNYKIIEEKNDFKNARTGLMGYVFISSLLVSIIAGIITITWQISHYALFVVSVVMAYLVLCFQIRKYIIYSIGQISITTFHDQDGFICNISTKEKINLSVPTLHYEITETVIDNRGTTSSTRTQNIFTSEKWLLNNSKTSQEFKLSYPSKKGLQPFDMKCVSIDWNMIIKGIFLGCIVEYEYPIKIELIDPFDAP